MIVKLGRSFVGSSNTHIVHGLRGLSPLVCGGVGPCEGSTARGARHRLEVAGLGLGGLLLPLGLLPHAQQVEGGVRGDVLILLRRHRVSSCNQGGVRWTVGQDEGLVSTRLH